jgi:PhzF family phenazine biosynthesis protein
VRFFTPRDEAAFIGHATIAAQYVRATLGGKPQSRLRQLSGIGIVEVDVFKFAGDYRVAFTQSAPAPGPLVTEPQRARVLEALGLSNTDLHPDYPLQLMGKSAPRLLIGLRSPQLLAALKPDFEQLRCLTPQVGAEGYFVFTLDAAGSAANTQSRLFCPALGFPEDPVSGNTHALLGVYFTHHGLLQPEGERVRFRGYQGTALGRPGVVEVEVICSERSAHSVRILGDAVIAAEVQLA